MRRRRAIQVLMLVLKARKRHLLKLILVNLKLKARVVLNKARRALPQEPRIWLAAAELEEAAAAEAADEQGRIKGHQRVGIVIKRGMSALEAASAAPTREWWLQEAVASETKRDTPVTAIAIVKQVAALEAEEAKKFSSIEEATERWCEDAHSFVADGAYECARASFRVAADACGSQSDSIWLQWARMELKIAQKSRSESSGTKKEETKVARDLFNNVVEEGLKSRPQCEEMWLMYARDVAYTRKDADGARKILMRAFEANPNSEHIWLAAAKLEVDAGEWTRAQQILSKARTAASNSARVWMRSAQVAREMDAKKEAKALLDEAIKRFPDYAKLYMMQGQLCEAEKDFDGARVAYAEGLKGFCGETSVALWRCAVRLECAESNWARARSLLEKARLRVTDPAGKAILWQESVLVEAMAGNLKVAQQTLASAMHELPSNGLLWALSIEMAPVSERNQRCGDALKRCDTDPHVLLAVAKHFWRLRKHAKARTWLQRAVTRSPSLGDAWAALYKFESAHGNAETVEAIAKQCEESEPAYGELWQRANKALGLRKRPIRTVLQEVAADMKV